MTDPTTASLERQLDERDRLRAENARLTNENEELRKQLDAQGLAAENAELRRLLKAEQEQVDRMGKHNLEALKILGGEYPQGIVDRVQALVDDRDAAVRSRDMAERDRDAEHGRAELCSQEAHMSRRENDRLSKALVEAHNTNEALIAERDRQAQLSAVKFVLDPNKAEAWAHLVAERLRYRALLEEACGELVDTGGEFAVKRAAVIRRAAGIEAS